MAPAGGQEALVAAVQSGADAVYMGFGAFNARRSARNFSDEEFRAAVSYCHLRGVKVYLTLNTLVTDRELPALAAEARTASECGVDAILVQDWGVLATLQKIIPDVPLHASTQMSLHTLSGVQEAARLGMTRAVLARELSRAGDRRNLPKKPHRDRNVRPRRAVHVLQRPVRDVRRHRAAQRQPRRLRPALPPALRLFRQGKRPSAEPEGRVSCALRARDAWTRALPASRSKGA